MVAVGVMLGVTVTVGVLVAVAVAVLVGVWVAVAVAVAVAVTVGDVVAVAVAVEVAVGVAPMASHPTSITIKNALNDLNINRSSCAYDKFKNGESISQAGESSYSMFPDDCSMRQ